MPPKINKLVYIAGYSRSGSTVLDILLGDHGDIFSCGELTYYFQDAQNPSRLCACGAQYQNCEIWSAVSSDLPDAEATLRKVESRGFSKVNATSKARYAKLMKPFLTQVRAASDCRVLIDSSKNAKDAAFRLGALNDIAGEQVYVIHLVRDCFSTIGSYHANGSNWVQEGYGEEKSFLLLRSTIGWLLANLIAWRHGRQYPYLRIRQQDFLHDPIQVLKKISAFIDEDLSDVIQKVEASELFYAGHNVGGNRVRKEGVQIRSQTVSDAKVPFYSKLFAYLCGAKLLERILLAPS
tara:strand:+ start:79067 stop:79948 length:882 start_codon:yes stop_codon:yes gene_type:complete